MTKHKISNNDKLEYSNCNCTKKTQIVAKFKDLNCDKTQKL